MGSREIAKRKLKMVWRLTAKSEAGRAREKQLGVVSGASKLSMNKHEGEQHRSILHANYFLVPACERSGKILRRLSVRRIGGFQGTESSAGKRKIRTVQEAGGKIELRASSTKDAAPGGWAYHAAIMGQSDEQKEQGRLADLYA